MGTATSITTHSEGSHSIALGGNQNPSAISAALTALGTLSAAPSIDVMFQTGYQPQGTYYGQAGLYFTCGTTVNNQYLGNVQLHGPTGSFNHYTFPSLPQNVATALSTTNTCAVKVELNLSNSGTVAVLVDKLSLGQASGSGGAGGAGAGGGAGSSGAAGKAGSGSGAGGKAGAGASGGGAGGSSGVGGSGGAGASGKSGGGGASGAGAAGKSGGGGVSGAGASGTSGSGGAGAGAGGMGGAAAGAGAAGSGGTSCGTGVEFYIDLPVHVPRTSVALGTSGGALVLNDSVRILASPSGFSSISSVKTTTETNLGVSAETLNLWSQANVVVLRDGAYVHGNLTTAGTVNTQNNVHVTGTETVNGTLTPIQHQSWIVQFPPTNGGPVNLDVSQVRSIVPGAYGGSTLQRNARLTLAGSGRYTLDGLFDLEPSSTLDVDNTQGPVQLYASGGFTFRGVISPRDPTKNNILIGIGGTGPIPMDTSFNAILVAPHGDVTLGSVNHSGAIYARSINVGAHVDFTHKPFAPNDLCAAGAACDGLCQCNPGGGCDDNGDCVTDVQCSQSECGGPTGVCTTSSQCGPGFDCTGGTCQSHCVLNPHAPECLPPHCGNGVKDAGETDVDCGGACNGCGSKHECGANDDCGAGLLCGPHNGGCFDGSRAKSLCWPAECAGVIDASECGSVDSPCGQNCSCARTCDSTSLSNTCVAGDSCVPGGGAMLGLNTQDACLPSGCPSDDPALAGTPTSLCGPTRVCTPDCSHATCGNADDGCGGQCRAVCPKGGGPCTADAQCQPGETCPESVDPSVPRVCRVADVCMYGPLKPPLCGPGAICGPCPVCAPQCGGKQCGPDPACGTDCGTCAAGQYCDGNGQCETPANDPPLTVPSGSGTPAQLPDLPPTPSSGVGAVAGAFAVTEQGTAQYTIPIDVPPGRAGIQPSLSLVYSDPHSSSEVGIGWHLQGLSTITRCSHIYALDSITSPVKGDDSDFFCIDGKRMTAIVGDYGKNGTEYRTQIDTFSKITSSTFESGGPDSFTVWTKDGRIVTYGNSCDSQVVGKGVRYAWLLNSVADHAGNTMNVSYQNNNALLQQSFAGLALPTSVIPSSITYTSHGNSPGNRQVRFSYEPRPDRSLRFLQGGIADLKDQRLSRIITYVSNQPVKNYHLKYPATGPSELYQITECEKDADTGCKAPTTFIYTTENATHFDPAVGSTIDMGAQLDANGDGIPDFTTSQVTTGPPANPPSAPRAITDIGIQVAGLFAPPGVGEWVSMFWNAVYPSLWGSKYVHPYMRESDFLYLGNGSRASNPFLAQDVQFVCGAASPMYFVDFDRDGKDDIGGFCSYDNQQQRDNLSLGFWTNPPGQFQTLNSYTSGAHIYAASISLSNLPHKDPILFDIDGDSLEDLLWCQDQYTLQLRRRKPVDAVLQAGEEFFYDPITLTAPTSGSPLLLCETDADSHTFVDIDGDGTTDLLARDFSNPWSVLKYSKTGPDDPGTIAWQPLGFEDSGDSASGGNVTLGDHNGDGLVDFMRVDGNQATVWLNMGNGSFFQRNLDHPVPPSNFEYRRSAVLDYNGDGITDLLENWGDNGVGYSVAMMPNSDASAFLTAIVATDVQAHTADGAVISSTFDGATDIDADGNIDLLGPHGTNYGHRAQYQQLSRVTDGVGNVVTIKYDEPNAYTDTCTGSTWPETCLRRMTGLVSSYSNQVIDNDNQTLVGESSHSYTYTNGRMNTEGHGFLGFDSRIIVENFDDHVPLQPANRKTTLVTEPPTRYTPAGQPSAGSAPPYLYPLAGMTHSITVDETVSVNGTTQPLETDTYQRRMHIDNEWQVGVSAYGRPFPKLGMRDTTLYDRRVTAPESDNGQLLTEHAEAFNIDTMGNMYTHDEEFQPSGAGGAFETRNMTAFYNVDVDHWLIARPSNVTTRTKRGLDWELVHDVNYTYYDNGFLKTITRYSGSHPLSQTAYTRDDFGNAWEITDTGSNGETPRTTTITFDEDNVFPTLIINPANQWTSVHFDTSWGVPKTVIDPNGIAVRTSYDGLGLISTEIDPEGTTTYTYSSLAPGAVSGTTAAGTIRPRTSVTVDRQGTGPSHGSHVTSQLDSHGRAVRTTAVGFNGVDVITESVFDGRGRVAGTTLGHSSDATAIPSSVYSYDDLNRLTGVQRSDGSTVQHQYASRVTLNQNYDNWLTGIDCGAGDAACVTDIELDIDERGRRLVSVKDYEGRVVRSIDETNISTVAESDRYIFGSGGHLLNAYDHLGNVTSLAYDVFGRLIGESDRDTLHKGYTYDSFNQVATSTDASARLRTYFHDVLGRLREIDDANGVTTWTYDEGANAVGRLSSMVSPATVENPDGQRIDYTYEAVTDVNRGLLHQVDYVLDHTHHAFTFGYDDLGRSSRIDYPDLGTGAQVTALYRYDDASGALKSLTQRNADGSEKPLWQMTDAYQGQLVQTETFGNGVTTTYQYTPEQHWLKNIATQRGATSVQQLGYTFWPTGQVMTRSNGVTQNDAAYDYDNLNRLGTLTPSVAGQQQPAMAFGYDDIDNLTQRGGTSTAYKPGGSHFVDTVGGNIYHYDPNGNVQDRSGPDVPGGTQTFTYTPFDLPSIITTGDITTQFEYSADEDRVVRRDPGVGTRYFAGAFYQRFADPNGTTQDERFRLYADSRLIGEIVRKSGTDQTLFFHTDHLGSVDTITNDQDSSVQHQEYDPFGKETLTPSMPVTRVGFTGQDHDRDLGLIDMHGRIYDPLAGRFLTADPLLQGLNHYSYVQNDPINLTDPSGLFTLNGDAASGVYDFGDVDPVTVPRPSAVGGGNFGSFGDIPDVTAAGGGGYQAALGDPASVAAAAVNIARDLFELAGGTPGAGSPITTTLPVGHHAPANVGATHSGASALGQNHGGVGPTPARSNPPEPYLQPLAPLQFLWDLLNQALGGGGADSTLPDVYDPDKTEPLDETQPDPGEGGARKPPGNARAQLTTSPDPSSWRQFGHTFSRHGQGGKVTRNLTGRARGTGNPQGQWLNNQAAARWLARQVVDVQGSIYVRGLPSGLGQVIMPSGEVVPANGAEIYFKPDGSIRTAFPTFHPGL